MPYREQYQTIDRKIMNSFSFRAIIVGGALAMATAGALITDYITRSSTKSAQTQTYEVKK